MALDVLDTPAAALTQQLLDEAREELTRADSKAAMLFAIFGIGLGAVLGGIIAGDWRPANLAAGAQVVWWFGAVTAVAGVVAVAGAIWPRVDSDRASGRVTYFGHVVGYRTRDALREAIERQADRGGERPLEQLEAVSDIVMTKYRLVRIGLILYGLGAVSCAVSVLVS